ncbi:Cation-independent mannose-6-phosphate receptor [Gossypium arboreum]|uniref:Cation-independent mannose-6-phosphate receptor n=1 Tax=Gossypium arboreum TaxID=29729 RepID=A0A0B0NJL0_GOSAR|nr:Cation-independent mannose-6-phosphate receptor [Gossypium arboreum]
MLHDHVSPGVPYDFNQFRPRPRHTGMSYGSVIKLVCMPEFDTV